MNDDTIYVPNASRAVVPVLMNRLGFKRNVSFEFSAVALRNLKVVRLGFKRNVSFEFSAVALWNLKVVLKGCVAVSLLALVWLVLCYKVSLGWC